VSNQGSQVPLEGDPPGRILGLDVGTKRIGLAVSDPLGVTAQGLETLQRQNKRLDFEQLAKVIRDYDVRQIVVGNPLRMSGESGPQADRMALFAEELRRRFQLPVHLWDERLTSVQANRLLRETELSIQRRAQAIIWGGPPSGCRPIIRPVQERCRKDVGLRQPQGPATR
jgi:putative Holliday junction resolvase